ncbi:hypothetical protein OPQ81_010323 [Rhizoctonia solani]|nr:hypothetical protein OPQ81_010323 [Rhizoctonia solani]
MVNTLYDNRLNTLKAIERSPGPNLLDRLGKARPVFKAILEFGQAVSELHPTAKTVFAVCVKAWEKLEEQEGCDENVRELIEGLVDMSELVLQVKNRTRIQALKKTIEEILLLMEDVAMFIVDHQLQLSRNRPLVSTFWILFDSSGREKANRLITRFQRLKEQFNTGLGVETHGIVQQIQVADFRRLLNELQLVPSARYNPEASCQEGTRECVICDILTWSEHGPATEGMLLVRGQAGIGKSSIASSVCKRLAERKLLASSFFCKRDVPNLRDPLQSINNVAHELATHCPPYGKALALAINSDQWLCTAYMQERYEGLIKEPLEGVKGFEPAGGSALTVLIDGLDECGTEDSRQSLLKQLWGMSRLVPWLKIIVMCRPSRGIQSFLESSRNGGVKFLEVQEYDASDDIRSYIHKELGGIASKDQWPEGQIEKLWKKADGIFIWAATANKYIKGSMASTLPRLEKVLEDKKSTLSENLDDLYSSVILEGMKDKEEDNKDLIRRCIGAIVTASTRRPLPISDLSDFLLGKADYRGMEQVINSLSAVLHIDQQLNGAVRFYHPSFADYATDPVRSGEFYIHPDKCHKELAEGCLKTLEIGLRFNICNLESSYKFNRQIKDLSDRVASKISNRLKYGCTYWISHLVEAPEGSFLQEVDKLISGASLMYWLEVLSLIGQLDVALEGLPRLAVWLPISALALAPRQSFVARRIGPLFPNRVSVIKAGDEMWPQWLRAMPHPGNVTSLSVSADQQKLATGCDDGSIYMWDLITGLPIGEELVGHTLKVMSIAFSPDGRHLVSGSFDKNLRLWDTKAGNSHNSIKVGQHFNAVSCVSFSPKGDQIASASWDGTVRLWDTQNKNSFIISFIGHSSSVTSVAFSPDGAQIASGSWDFTVRLWDTKTGPMIHTFKGHTSEVTTVAFSPDSRCIASGSKDSTIRVWDLKNRSNTGTPLYGHFKSVKSIAFSPDGTHLVSGSKDRTVRIWDTRMGVPAGRPLLGHDNKVSSVAFLPSGIRVISGSHDQTVRMWELNSQNIGPNQSAGHSLAVTSIACSPKGQYIVSGSHDTTIRIWDLNTGGAIGQPLLGHTLYVSSVAFSPDGTQVVSGSYDNTARIWDIEKGSTIGQPLFGHTDSVTSVAFSPKGDIIASGSLDKTIRLWNPRTCSAMGGPLVGHSMAVASIAFSPDGAYIASGSYDKTVRVWDLNTPDHPVKVTFSGHSGPVTSVDFLPDGIRVVSGSTDKTVCMWDITTESTTKIAQFLHSKSVTSVAASPNGLFIASGSWDKTIKLWDTNTGNLVGSPIIEHSSTVTSLAFSPDGHFLVSSSDDKSINGPLFPQSFLAILRIQIGLALTR